MKLIPLTQNKVAQVDDADFAELSQFKWHAIKVRHNWYAARKGTRPTRETILMHRVISAAPNGVKVDHWDRDSLNNTRLNLRTATNSQNLANRGKQSNNTSGYKGVSWDKSHGAWKVKLTVAGRIVQVGRFADLIGAAYAYDHAAIEHFGPFASLNFPASH